MAEAKEAKEITELRDSVKVYISGNEQQKQQIKATIINQLVKLLSFGPPGDTFVDVALNRMNSNEFVAFANLFKDNIFLGILNDYVGLDREMKKSLEVMKLDADTERFVKSIVKNLLQLQANSIVIRMGKMKTVEQVPESVDKLLGLMKDKLIRINSMFETVHSLTPKQLEIKGGYSQSPYQGKYIKYKAKYMHQKYGSCY